MGLERAEYVEQLYVQRLDLDAVDVDEDQRHARTERRGQRADFGLLLGVGDQPVFTGRASTVLSALTTTR